MTERCDLLYKIYHHNEEVEFIENDLYNYYFTQAQEIVKKDNGELNLQNLSNCLVSSIEKDSIVKEIERLTYLALADYYYKSIDIDNALRCLAKIYTQDQKDLHIYIKDCLVRKLSTISNPKNGLDSISSYTNIFPFLKEDENILGYKAWCQLKIVHTHFELNELEEGLKYLEEFRKEFKPEDKVLFPEDMIGFGFGAASSYYFRKNDFKKAEELLVEGLKYSSYNVSLRRKLKLLKEEGY